jgi:hypothetical protein
MMKDPLHFFAHEKVAEDSAPSSAMEDAEEDYTIPQTLSRSALDPGERALAGVASVSGSLATSLVPFVTRLALTYDDKKVWSLGEGAASWKGQPVIQNAKSIAEGLDPNAGRGAVNTKGKVLGLFDVKGRERKFPMVPGSPARLAWEKRYIGKLQEIQPVVDSFIDKHNLTKKGVRINIQSGPLSGRGGGSFNMANKQVYLPNVGKELALHELGHAADYTGRFGKLRRFAEPVLKRSVMVALPVALAAGDRIKEMIPGTVDDKAISFMQDHAPEIMGATIAATTLFPEAKASILAVKHLKELELAGKQPKGTALRAVKKLAPFWGTYLVGAIPAIVGMSLARKYMREARKDKASHNEEMEKHIEEIEKKAGIGKDLFESGKDLIHVTRQIGRGTKNLIRDPDTIRHIGRAAKETGQSPEFVLGALSSAVPAAMGALYMYGTPGGELIRNRLDPHAQKTLLGHGSREVPGIAGKDEEWRKDNPLRFAGLVAVGAALSGGIMTKFLHDLTKVL